MDFREFWLVMRCLILGCGYVGSRFADYSVSNGWETSATSRSASKLTELASHGVQVLEVDWLDPQSLRDLPRVDYLLISVSHSQIPGMSPESVHCQGLQNLFAGDWPSLKRVVYLSTTGVYGSATGGAWLDESTPTQPTRPSSVTAVAAEKWLAEHPEIPATTLRLAGIYGPHRIPNLDRLRRGETIEIDPHSYLNLIHVDDIVGIIGQVFRQDTIDRCYCVSDGHPVTRAEYYGQLCDWMGVPAPTIQPPSESSMKSPETWVPRRGQDKRISNRKLLSEIGWKLRYPSIREGMKELVQEANMRDVGST